MRPVAGSVLFEALGWSDSPSEHPMHVIAQADQGRFSVAKGLMEFTGVIGHLRGVIVDTQTDPQFFEAGPKLIEGLGLDAEFVIGLLPPDRVGITVDDGESRFLT